MYTGNDYDSHIIFIATDCLTGNDPYKLLNLGHYEAPPTPLLHRHSRQNISAGVKCGIFQNIVQMEMAFFMKTLND